MRVWGLLASALAALVLTVAPASAAPAKPGPTTVPPPPPLPQAYVLVDVDTGNVLAGSDARTKALPASTIKILTALMAAERLPTTDQVPISALASSMPARSMNVKAGQTWALQDLLHAMLMVSANDAAVAVAERVGGGSLDGWQAVAERTVARLGLQDDPQLRDPAGLDDEFARGGGTLISPRDLAIIARAVLARPDLMAIVQTPRYTFTGGDALGHELKNQDMFFSLYEGATGLKTGGTERAGLTFVGTATRGGRTMMAVVFKGVDPLRQAGLLLDQGFATPVAAEPTTDRLPAVVPDAAVDPPPTTEAGEAAAAAAVPAVTPKASSGLSLDSTPVAVAVLVLGLVLLGFVRRAMLERYAGGRAEGIAVRPPPPRTRAPS